MTKNKENQVIDVWDDGFTVNTKLMEQYVEYDFVYDGTKMSVKLTEGGDLQVGS